MTMHDSITFAIRDNFPELWAQADDIAEKVMDALDIGMPCAANGCRMRQIVRRAQQDR